MDSEATGPDAEQLVIVQEAVLDNEFAKTVEAMANLIGAETQPMDDPTSVDSTAAAGLSRSSSYTETMSPTEINSSRTSGYIPPTPLTAEATRIKSWPALKKSDSRELLHVPIMVPNIDEQSAMINFRKLEQIWQVRRLVSSNTKISRRLAHRIFRALDTNKDHKLSRQELRFGLHHLGFFDLFVLPRKETCTDVGLDTQVSSSALGDTEFMITSNLTQDEELSLFNGVMTTIDKRKTGTIYEADFITELQNESIEEFAAKVAKAQTNDSIHQHGEELEWMVRIVDYGFDSDETGRFSVYLDSNGQDAYIEEVDQAFRAVSNFGPILVSPRELPTVKEKKTSKTQKSSTKSRLHRNAFKTLGEWFDKAPPLSESYKGVGCVRQSYRWIDIRGWNTSLAQLLTNKYSLPHTLAYDAGVTQAARFDLENFDDVPGVEAVVHLICHTIRLQNKPYTRDLKLKDKAHLDRCPPSLYTEQINVIVLRPKTGSAVVTNDDDSCNTELLITIMKDTRYRKLHQKARKQLEGQRVSKVWSQQSLMHRPGMPAERHIGSMINTGTIAFARVEPISATQIVEDFCLVIGDWNSSVEKFDEAVGFDLMLNRKHEAIETAPEAFVQKSSLMVAWSIVESTIDELDYLRSELQAYIDVLDDEVTKEPNENHPQHLHDLTIILAEVLQKISPIVENFSVLDDPDAPLTSLLSSTNVLASFKQTKGNYDHIVNEMQGLVTRLENLKIIYRSQKDDKQNKILFILTLVTTIVIPGQLLTGVYGMNFEHMPELAYRWMYPEGFWAIFFVFSSAIIFIFRYNKLL